VKKREREGRRKRGSFKLPFVNAFPVKTQNSKLKTQNSLPITNYQLPITNYQLPNTRSRYETY
ncbi:MAG: hypothetical protein HC786_05125, partial [Richelia sp. CSU_2_1]|nr:hypothetical protein [Richelia sp. CSU_2_1]